MAPSAGYTRSYAAETDRSWDGNSIDALAKIEEIAQTDAHVAIQLKLEAAFGLRAKESWRLRPAASTTRVMAARTNPERGSLIPATYTQDQWR